MDALFAGNLVFHHQLLFSQKIWFFISGKEDKYQAITFVCNSNYMVLLSSNIMFFLIWDLLSDEFSSPKFYSSHLFKFLFLWPKFKGLNPLTPNIHLFEGSKSMTFSRLLSVFGFRQWSQHFIALLHSTFMTEPSP